METDGKRIKLNYSEGNKEYGVENNLTKQQAFILDYSLIQSFKQSKWWKNNYNFTLT